MTELIEKWKINARDAVRALDSFFVPTSGIRQMRRDRRMGLDVSEDVLGVYTLEAMRIAVYALVVCDIYNIFNR